MKYSNYRLSPTSTALVHQGVNVVTIAPADDKKALNLITKNTEDCVVGVGIEDNEFSLKLTELNGLLAALVKSSYLPDPDTWYLVDNFNSDISSIVSQLNCKMGEFDTTFEACFSSDCPREVGFICCEMKEYKDCFAEMERRLNFTLHKKTKKWIPGHRYDSETETKYFLGTLVSRRMIPGKSKFIEDPLSLPEVNLYVNNLRSSDRSVSDILKTRCFGNGPDDIKVLYTTSLLVDCGEAIKPDMPEDITTIWEEMITMAADKNQERNSDGLVLMKNPKQVFDVVSYQSPGKVTNRYKNNIVNLITDFTKQLVRGIFLEYWDWDNFSAKLDDTLTEDQIVINATKLLPNMFSDENLLKGEYYEGLLKSLGIDLPEIIKQGLVKWKKELKDIKSQSIENYLLYRHYHEKRTQQAVSTQRVESTKYPLTCTKIADFFGASELTETIIELLESARDNFGLGVTEYYVVNMGTRKQPNEYVSCIIELNDIIKFKKGISEMSESLKHDIVANKFRGIKIIIDKNKKPE